LSVIISIYTAASVEYLIAELLCYDIWYHYDRYLVGIA